MRLGYLAVVLVVLLVLALIYRNDPKAYSEWYGE